MIETIRNILGLSPKVDYANLIAEGAILLDVRSKGEFEGGHIQDSINLPLDSLNNSLSQFKRDKAIIICCASGMRSAIAKSILKSKGFAEVYNGGGWKELQKKFK